MHVCLKPLGELSHRRGVTKTFTKVPTSLSIHWQHIYKPYILFAGTRQAFLPGGPRTGAPGKHVVRGKSKYRLVDEKVRYYVAPSIEDIQNSPVGPPFGSLPPISDSRGLHTAKTLRRCWCQANRGTEEGDIREVAERRPDWRTLLQDRTPYYDDKFGDRDQVGVGIAAEKYSSIYLNVRAEAITPIHMLTACTQQGL